MSRNNNGKSSAAGTSQTSKEPRTTILSRNGREQLKTGSSGDVRNNTGQKSVGKSSTAGNSRAPDNNSSSPLDGGSSPSKQPTAILQPPLRSQGKGTNRTNESYGVVFSLKPNFGFIQPLYSDEQIYFPSKEYFDGIKIGDRVGYIVRSSTKGDFAEGLRHLVQMSDVLLTGSKGLITRTIEAHRSGFGLIEIETTSLPAESICTLQNLGCAKPTSSTSKASAEPTFQSIPFRLADVNSQQKVRRLDKGDYVEFNLAQIGANSSLLQALSIRLLQSKSERAAATQIQRMLDAGAVREMGSICSIKRVGEFGFIKSIARKEEIFFKLDDIVDQSVQVSEGTEVEFFVIAESNKGKLSDRAIHLKVLPPGTVKFEITIAKKVTATVVQNCETHPEESPGMLRLHSPIRVKEITDVEGNELKEVELWQRCLPEEFICKIGDVVTLDVHYYKPEKLYFARSVRIKCFRKLGRETGRVVAIKEHGFGFVHSASRGVDIYFKCTLVVGPSGAFVSESSLKMDSLVSFDVSVENTSSGGKFRAQRVMLVPGSSTDSKALLVDVLGIVIRNAKGGSPGLIRTSPDRVSEIKDIKPFDPELVQAITEFSELPQWKKLSIFGIPAATLRSYMGVIENGIVPGVIFEVTLIDDNDPGLGKVITIEKCPPDEYETWLATANAKSKPKESESSRKKESAAAKDAIHFYKEDYVTEDFGSIGNDLTVLFDVIWDSSKGRHVAKNIRMTDEPVPTSDGDGTQKQAGVLDVVVDKSGGKFGFIRCLESDEKLYWNLSAPMMAAIRAAGKSSDSDVSIHVGREVLFSLRRRGGLRCATDIELVEEGSLSKEVESPFVCTGIVTEKQQLVLADVSRNHHLSRKYIDLKLFSDLMANSRDLKSGGDSKASSSTWEKLGAVNSKESQPTPTTIPAASSAPPAEAADEDGFVEGSGDQDGVKDLDEYSEFRVEYKPKYFPCIPRKPVSLAGNAESSFPVGTVVNCLVSVNWVLQRSPLHANIVSERIEQKGAQKGLKKRGRIVRLKFRAKPLDASSTSITTPSGPADELVLTYNISSVEFVEICESDERAGKLSDSPSSAFYYCDVREIAVSDENGREKLQTGDELEFWCVPSFGNIAFSPSLVNKSGTDYAGIQFIKRPTVNTDLKLKEKSVIIMAKGPPSEAAKGFELGWRSTYTVNTSTDALPWTNLLTGAYLT